ncbi:uncharacterized protein LOC114520855 [Dendronephthya gigantea]|uniref:uncharacterized protein LOC114520855 n=1 Tax=Dendronephthya gigantea TaxID=151771 RepID=UPI00106ABC55|nr:uncharacterized protein LOC114520855 [Dendronephthya gigantea]
MMLVAKSDVFGKPTRMAREIFSRAKLHTCVNRFATLWKLWTFKRSHTIIQQKMPSNVEIKATIRDYDQFRSLAETISGQKGELIVQEDIFFHAPNGRLKLRILQDRPSELISYSRSDQSGPKLSEFYITEIPKPEDLKKTLGTSLGVKGVVKKERLLFLVGQTRIHLDKVESLGCFMELEVVLRENQTTNEGSEVASDLMKKLNINEDDLITCAYIDLLCGRKK